MTLKAAIIIRNAEMNDDPPDRFLSARGRSRAYLLYEQRLRMFRSIGEIDKVFACSPSIESVSAIETLVPIANNLGCGINHNFAYDNYAGLTAELFSERYNNKIVLISWRCETLPNLIMALKGDVSIAPMIKDRFSSYVWPENIYDKFVVLTYPTDGTPPNTASYNQSLLYGDN